MGKTQSEILKDILNNIDSSYNKSEGEFIWDFSNAVAKSISDDYKKQDEEIDRNFVSTAKGKDLDKLIKQRIGKSRKNSTYASGTVKITGNEGTKITIGMLIANNTNNYQITENATIGSSKTVTVNCTCVNSGSTGNTGVGTIIYFPKTISGLQTVTNESAFTNGYDTETDEEYKQRYFDYVGSPATSGNKYHYKNWAMDVSGVGDCTVIPGAGNVKVIIVNSNKQVADSDLVEKVKSYIDDNRPVLAGTLTVASATKLEINISVKVNYDSESYTSTQIKENIEKEITKYLKENYSNNFVSYARIGYCILESSGVKDYSNLTINGSTNNVDINNTQVAQLGGVTLE